MTRSGGLWRSATAVMLALACMAGWVLPGAAQPVEPARGDIEQIEREAATRTAEKTAEKQAREAELKAVEERLAASASLRAKLESEIAGIRADKAALNAALIETTSRTQGLERRIDGLESRLATLTASEQAISRSLEGRRGLIAQVLAALQRMGRRPPPAVIVRPEDMLAAVRASILLGAVVPELRQEIEMLASDLGELARLRGGIAADRKALADEFEHLATERQRLARLIDARKQRETDAAGDADREKSRADGLLREARTMRELVDQIEKEIAATARLVDDARRLGDSATREQRDRMAALALKDPARLAPRIAFAETRGVLPLPVAGSQIRAYGANDGFGGTTRGISLATRSKALVSAPADASVAFAGPFRSFGQLLILNAGGGYYILLAGMQRINVVTGQFVLAGEPVAMMSEFSPAVQAAGEGKTSGDGRTDGVDEGQPVLYVEFRKDGAPFDPGPWWAKSQGEKVRG
jgi:septal ring factor EnvC (AmiA/AmiB activator)